MGLTLAYHSACSMQHGQKITDEPKKLLRAAGFNVSTLNDLGRLLQCRRISEC